MKTFRWALFWALCILVLCLLPGRALPKWDWFALFDLDKVVHVGMFGVLTVLLADAMRKRDAYARYILRAAFVSICYGVATEFMQGMELLGRRTDPGDMVANTVGALLGGLYVRFRERSGKPIVPIAFLR